MTTNFPIKLERLPKTLLREGAVRVELAQGVLVFRASRFFLERIGILTAKRNVAELTSEHYPLQGTVDRYDDPFEPALPLEEWEALQ